MKIEVGAMKSQKPARRKHLLDKAFGLLYLSHRTVGFDGRGADRRRATAELHVEFVRTKGELWVQLKLTNI